MSKEIREKIRHEKTRTFSDAGWFVVVIFYLLGKQTLHFAILAEVKLVKLIHLGDTVTIWFGIVEQIPVAKLQVNCLW